MTMRLAIVVLLATATPALADGYLELGAGFAFGRLDGTRTTHTVFPAAEGIFTTDRTTTGGGLALAVGGGIRHGIWRLGGFGRLQRFTMVFEDPRVPPFDNVLEAMTIGPTIGIAVRGFHARAEVGTGRFTGEYLTIPAGGVHGVRTIGVELGYELAFRSGTTVRPALSLTSTRTHAFAEREAGDRATRDDRNRLLAAALTVSIVPRF